ncbi:unnamed protein product [Bemisia tabaci]|uniref:Uncharacterized protein n=1 Tax=Bemisia tabaci TaxID=7038 RepID=A0A9P0ALC4_BEMTA|nr:unnamed protein product [Bemisia tabaci]
MDISCSKISEKKETCVVHHIIDWRRQVLRNDDLLLNHIEAKRQYRALKLSIDIVYSLEVQQTKAQYCYAYTSNKFLYKALPCNHEVYCRDSLKEAVKPRHHSFSTQEGTMTDRANYVPVKLLAAARQQSPDSVNSLSDCIDPRNYAVVLGAAKNVTGFDAATHRVENPGTVDRLLALLRDAVSLKREETATSSVLPEESKRDLMEQCRRFDDLLSSAWPVDIGKHAQATTLQRRCSNPPQIPVSADIHALFREATSMVARSTALLEFQVTEKNFVQLSEALLAALVIKVKLSQLSHRPSRC